MDDAAHRRKGANLVPGTPEPGNPLLRLARKPLSQRTHAASRRTGNVRSPMSRAARRVLGSSQGPKIPDLPRMVSIVGGHPNEAQHRGHLLAGKRALQRLLIGRLHPCLQSVREIAQGGNVRPPGTVVSGHVPPVARLEGQRMWRGDPSSPPR